MALGNCTSLFELRPGWVLQVWPRRSCGAADQTFCLQLLPRAAEQAPQKGNVHRIVLYHVNSNFEKLGGPHQSLAEVDFPSSLTLASFHLVYDLTILLGTAYHSALLVAMAPSAHATIRVRAACGLETTGCG